MSLVVMRKKMHGWTQWVMLLLAIILAVGIIAMGIGGNRDMPQSDSSVGGVVAKVNRDNIEREEFEARVKEQMDQLTKTQEVGLAMASQIRSQIFDQMVDETLKLQAAREMGIKISGGDLNKRLDQYVTQQIAQIKDGLLRDSKVKTDKAFEKAIQRQDPTLTLDKLRDQIRQSINEDKLRMYMTMEELSNQLKRKARTSDKAFRASFDELKLRQITIGMHKRSEEQAQKMAKDLVAKLRGGADFVAMAKANSEDMLRDKGGDYGQPIRQNMIQPELNDVAFKLKPGEISDPIKIAEGIVILKLDARRSVLPPDFNDPAKQREYRQKFVADAQNRAESLFYANLQKKADIKMYDPEMKAYSLVKETFSMFGPTTAPQRKAKYLKAVQEYRSAISTAGERSDIKARCYASVAMLYGILKQPDFSPTPDEVKQYDTEIIRALEDALKNDEDVSIEMQLGQMYVDAGNYPKAIEHLDIASANAWDNYQIHQQLIGLYKKMNRPDLVANEKKWLEENKDKAPSAQGQGQMMPPSAAR